MTFRCQRCGDCCSTMGEIISIREELLPYEFRIGYTNGEERRVTVEPGDRDLFRMKGRDEKRSPACPFLRRRSPRETFCTVHATRPELCRSYACFRILVLDPEGRRAGRVLAGTRYFATEAVVLSDLWRREIRDTEIVDEGQWEAYAYGVFTRAGYRVIR